MSQVVLSHVLAFSFFCFGVYLYIVLLSEIKDKFIDKHILCVLFLYLSSLIFNSQYIYII